MKKEENFHSVVKNCVLISRETSLVYSVNDSDEIPERVKTEYCFWFPRGEQYDGLCEVHLDGYLICALEKASIKDLAPVIPEIMKVSLFKVLKYWFKAWFK